MYRIILLKLNRSGEDVAILWQGLIPTLIAPGVGIKEKAQTREWRTLTQLTVSFAVFLLLNNNLNFPAVHVLDMSANSHRKASYARPTTH